MSTATNSKSAVSAAANAAATAAANAVNAVTSSWYTHPAVKVIVGLIGVLLYILSFYFGSDFIGGRDGWNDLKGPVGKTFGTAMAGSLLLFALASLFFVQDKTYVIHVVLLLSFLTFGMAFSALAISAITK